MSARRIVHYPGMRFPFLCAATLTGFGALAGCGARSDVADGLALPSAGGGGAAASTASSAGVGGCHDEVIATDVDGATTLAIDGASVFWGTTDGLVQKREAGTTTVLAQAGSAVSSVAVDAENVYYTDGGDILAVARAGGSPFVVASQVGQPFAIVPDGAALYFLDYGSGIAAGRALRADIGGATTELLKGLDVPSGLAVDEHDVFIVVAEGILLQGQFLSGALVRVPKQGGTATVLATGLHQAASVALDQDRVYFLEQVDASFNEQGGLRSVPKAGGPVTPLATTPDVLPVDVAVDASGAYVTTFGGPTNASRSHLLRAALDGSGAVELAATDGVVYGAVRVAPEALYWAIGWTTWQVHTDLASVRKKCK